MCFVIAKRANASTRRIVSRVTPVRTNRIIVVADTRQGLTRVLMRCGFSGPLCQITMLVRASPRGFSVDVRSDYTRISRGSFAAAGSPSEMSNVPGRKKERRSCSACVLGPSIMFLFFFFFFLRRLANLSFPSPAFPVVHPRQRFSWTENYDGCPFLFFLRC